MWDFDYFVETYLKVVNLLIKMRILLSFICCNDDDLKYFLLYGYVCVIFSLMRILLSFACCNDYFVINEFKFAWGFDGGFGKSIGGVVVIFLGLCKMGLI